MMSLEKRKRMKIHVGKPHRKWSLRRQRWKHKTKIYLNEAKCTVDWNATIQDKAQCQAFEPSTSTFRGIICYG
jgi:hypothetical protein